MANDFDTELPIEAYTTVFDYLKHLTTLSTGSILLIVAFLEKLFTKPECKACVVVSLCGFVGSILACLVSQAGVIEQIDSRHGVASWAHPLAFWSLVVAWAAFLTGIISLTVFAIVNLY